MASPETLFNDSRKHPFIEASSLGKLRALYGDIYKELEGKKDFYSKRLTNDDILEIIGEYFTEKVGDEFDQDTYTALCEEAEKRYADRTPPGYKDAGKNDGNDLDRKKYGDYVLWRQVIEKSKTSKQNVIFVTDDKKEDWWLEQSGKTIGPRPELIKEFQEETHQLIYMYQSDRFFEYANSYYNESVNERALDEIRELVNLDGKRREKYEALNLKRELISKKELERLYNEKLMLEKELEGLFKRRNNWSEKLLELNSHMDNLNIHETDFDSYKTHQEKILIQLHSLEQRIEDIRSRLDTLKEKGFRTREFRY